MATTRLMPLHTGKGRTVGQAISDIIDYSKNPQKTDKAFTATRSRKSRKRCGLTSGQRKKA